MRTTSALILLCLTSVCLAGGSAPIPTLGLRTWLDAAETATFTFDNTGGGVTVSAWASRAPATDTLMQPTKARQPSRVASPGFNHVLFDGVDDVLSRTLGAQTDIDEPTVFLVLAPLSNQGANQYRAFLSWTRGTQNDYQVGLNIDMKNFPTADFSVFNIEGAKITTPGGFDFMTTGFAFNVPTITQTNYWNSSIIATINGAAQASALTPTNNNPIAFDTFRLGARYYLTTERGYCHVKIAEVIVYDRALNACEINTVGRYLSSKYGITAPYLRPDINGDGVINTADLTAFLSSFGLSVPAFTRGDINGDGVVNTVDLTAFLGVFGQSC